MDEKMKLSSPWILLYNKIEALFRKDPAVSVVYVENRDGSEKTIKLYVDGHDKVGALEKLLPKVYMLGGVAVNVEILPSNLDGCTIYVALFPCCECAKAIIQSGIKKVMYLSDKYALSDSTRASKRMLDAAGVKYEKIEIKHKQITIDFDENLV